MRPTNATRPTAVATESRSPARVSVASTAVASDLVLPTGEPSKLTTSKFIVGGFRPDAPVHAVHDLVQSVAGDLHDFRRLPANGPSAPAAAYIFFLFDVRGFRV